MSMDFIGKWSMGTIEGKWVGIDAATGMLNAASAVQGSDRKFNAYGDPARFMLQAANGKYVCAAAKGYQANALRTDANVIHFAIESTGSNEIRIVDLGPLGAGPQNYYWNVNETALERIDKGSAPPATTGFTRTEVTVGLAQFKAHGFPDPAPDLSFVCLAGADLTGVSFTRADLSDADLSDANLTGAPFQKTILNGADLSRAKLSDMVDFTGATLQKATLVDAVLTNAIMNEADLTGADLSGAGLSGCSLNNTLCRKATLRKTDLSNGFVTGTDFTGADMNAAIFTGAVVRNITIVDADLTGARLSNPDLKNPTIDLSDAKLSAKTNFTHAAMQYVDLSGHDLQHVDMAHTDLTGSRLDGTQLSHAELSYANLTDATMTGSIPMFAANLSNATLTGADLTGAQMGSISLLFRVDDPDQFAVFKDALTAGDVKTVKSIFKNGGVALQGAVTIEASQYAPGRVWEITSSQKSYTVRLEAPPDASQSISVYETVTAAILTNAFMKGAVLTSANLYNVRASGAQLYGGARMDGNAILERAQFDNANMGGINLKQAKLYGVNLDYAVLTNAQFQGAALCTDAGGGQATLERANLQGADFSDADLTDVIFSDAAVSVARSEGSELVDGVWLFSVPEDDALSNELAAGSDQFCLDTQLSPDLKQGPVSDPVRNAFKSNGIQLGSDALVIVEATGPLWHLTDGSAAYTISRDCDQDQFQPALAVRKNDDGPPIFMLPLNLEKYLKTGPVSSQIIDAFKKQGVSLGSDARVTADTRATDWQVADAQASYTLWLALDESCQWTIQARPSLPALIELFSSHSAPLSRRVTVQSTGSDSWCVDNDSNNPYNATTNYIRFNTVHNRNDGTLDIFGAAMRVCRMVSADEKQYHNINCDLTILPRAQLHATTVCPNSLRTVVNESDNIPFKKWMRARELPKAPFCVPSEDGYYYCPVGDMGHSVDEPQKDQLTTPNKGVCTMRKKEVVTLHFDLSHCPQDVEFTLQAGGGIRHKLTAYRDAPGKLEEHRQTNKALALLSDAQCSRITHFVEDAQMDAHRVSVRRVVYPSTDNHPLPEIALMFVHIPHSHQKKILKYDPPAGAPERPHPLFFSYYNIAPDNLNGLTTEEIHLHADRIKPPFETARSIVFHHPEIGSINPIVAKSVFDHHVKGTQDFQNLIQYVQSHPPQSKQPWYQKSWATWINPDTGKEEPMPANTSLKFKDGQTAAWPTNPDTGQPSLPLYDLTDEYNTPDQDTGVLGAAQPVICQVLRDTKNDKTLNGQLWTRQNGVTQKVQTQVPATPAQRVKAAPAADAALGAAAKGFAIKNTTSSYGLNLYSDQVAYDFDKRMLSFPVKNWPNRYLGAYVEFFKTDGTKIDRKDIPDWGHDSSFMMWLLSAMFGDTLQPSATESIVDIISPGNQVFGVPFPTNPVTLSFKWPEQASKADVLLGGLGVAGGFRDWNTGTDIVGTVFTGLFSYGITSMFLALTVSGATAAIMQKVVKKTGPIIYGIAAGLGIIATITGIATWKSSSGKWLLAKMSNQVLGLIFGNLDKIFDGIKTIAAKLGPQAAEEIEIEMTEFVGGVAATSSEVAAEEATEEVPYVGWALKVAAIAGDIATLTATTVECLLSPATYKLEVLHTMDLTVTVKPDPAHGKPGFNPVWPLVSDHYVIQVKYPKGNNQEGGTTFTKAGPMPGRHDAPIAVTFEQIPAGGKVEVTANIYSGNNWLAGVWNSGWLNADPDKQDQLSVSGNIRENLVPLTADTTYTQKQRIAYSDQQQHFWQVTLFSISDSFADVLDKGVLDDNLRKAFQANGNTFSADTRVTVLTPGTAWQLADKDSGVVFNIRKQKIYDSDNQTLYELQVQNSTHAAPQVPDVIEDCGPDGHRLCERKNITINNKEYQLGYAWRASGQNMPRDYGTTPDNGQMYAIQSISTLGEPEESIIEPGRGFSNPTCIAFDQFGLTPLFDLDPTQYRSVLNKGGAVPSAVITEFGKFSLTIPQDARITVLTPDQAWDLGLSGQDPLFSLRTVTVIKKGQQQEVIDVYSWPVPRLDNFFLDSRTYTPDAPIYHLRGIEFEKGRTIFDYDSKKSWGCFQNVTIKALAVHPGGYVVGADYDNHKLLALRLPAEAVDEDQAPIAMPLSGEGILEGLLNKPVALTISADGRILILEEGNRRVQAFDVKGNPVPCFSAGQKPFSLSETFIGALDSRQVETDLVQAFQTNVFPDLAPLFSCDFASAAALNEGRVDDTLSEAFSHNGYAGSQTGTPQFKVVVTTKDALWLATDTDTQSVYDIRTMTDSSGEQHLFVFHCFALAVDVKAPGKQWQISDTANAMTLEVIQTAGQKGLTAQRLVSFMPLRDEGPQSISYMDIAAEAKGYIYILSKAVQSTTTQYRLDIYNPDGTPLLKEPQTGINAARLTVDQWRSLFTLNYEKLLGPGNRTEPGISEWMPSTPGSPQA